MVAGGSAIAAREHKERHGIVLRVGANGNARGAEIQGRWSPEGGEGTGLGSVAGRRRMAAGWGREGSDGVRERGWVARGRSSSGKGKEKKKKEEKKEKRKRKWKKKIEGK